MVGLKFSPTNQQRDLERIDRQLNGVDPFGPFEYFSPKQRDEAERIKEALRRKFPVRIGSVSDRARPLH